VVAVDNGEGITVPKEISVAGQDPVKTNWRLDPAVPMFVIVAFPRLAGSPEMFEPTVNPAVAVTGRFTAPERSTVPVVFVVAFALMESPLLGTRVCG